MQKRLTIAAKAFEVDEDPDPPELPLPDVVVSIVTAKLVLSVVFCWPKVICDTVTPAKVLAANELKLLAKIRSVIDEYFVKSSLVKLVLVGRLSTPVRLWSGAFVWYFSNSDLPCVSFAQLTEVAEASRVVPVGTIVANFSINADVTSFPPVIWILVPEVELKVKADGETLFALMTALVGSFKAVIGVAEFNANALGAKEVILVADRSRVEGSVARVDPSVVAGVRFSLVL